MPKKIAIIALLVIAIIAVAEAVTYIAQQRQKGAEKVRQEERVNQEKKVDIETQLRELALEYAQNKMRDTIKQFEISESLGFICPRPKFFVDDDPIIRTRLQGTELYTVGVFICDSTSETLQDCLKRGLGWGYYNVFINGQTKEIFHTSFWASPEGVTCKKKQ